jgi:hypothetical protein
MHQSHLYLGELIAAILMFWGFLMAAAPQPDEVVQSAPALQKSGG